MNAQDAAYNTVHDYPGGAMALAPRMGMSAQILRAKVCPGTERNKLTLDEADRMMALTQDYRILQALNAEHGFALAPLDAAESSSASVGDMLLDSTIAGGNVAGAIKSALADGLITAREMQVITAAGLHEQAVLLRLLERLRALTGKRDAGRVVELGQHERSAL